METLQQFKERTGTVRWIDIFFYESFLQYPVEIDEKMKEIISNYIGFNFANCFMVSRFHDREEFCNFVHNAIMMNQFNISTKAKLLTAEYNPSYNYDKFSEVKNAYGEVRKSFNYGEDKNTIQNGSTNVTTTDQTSAYDSSGWTDTDKSTTSGASSTDVSTRNARTDGETSEAREDVITEHTYGNIGTMTISEILLGVWKLGDMEFVKFVADIIVTNCLSCVFDLEV